MKYYITLSNLVLSKLYDFDLSENKSWSLNLMVKCDHQILTPTLTSTQIKIIKLSQSKSERVI